MLASERYCLCLAAAVGLSHTLLNLVDEECQLSGTGLGACVNHTHVARRPLDAISVVSILGWGFRSQKSGFRSQESGDQVQKPGRLK